MFDDEEEAFSDWTESRTMGRNSVQVWLCICLSLKTPCLTPLSWDICLYLTETKFKFWPPPSIYSVWSNTATSNAVLKPNSNAKACLYCFYSKIRFHNFYFKIRFHHSETRFSCIQFHLLLISSLTCQPMSSSRAEFEEFFWLLKVFVHNIGELTKKQT